MAMSKSPVRAETHPTEGTRVVVLPPRDSSAPADVGPGRRDLAAVAAVQIRIEAHVLRRDREILLAVRRDAHAVARRLGAGEGPAAATIALVADVVDELGA